MTRPEPTPGTLALLALLAVASNLPLLTEGRFTDDYLMQAAFRGEARWTGRSPSLLDAFDFGDGDPVAYRERMRTGIAPWWADPHFKQRFLRPLSAATHLLDLVAWGGAPGPSRAQSLAWLALTVLAAGAVYRRLFGGRRAALLATVLLVAMPQLVQLVGWISSRNTLLTLLSAVLVLGAHLRWRETGRAGHLLASLACLVLGLLAGEGAVAGAILVAVHAACLEEGEPGARLRAAAPAALVVAAWWVAYRLAGFGVAASGLYLDPAPTDPAFLLEFGRRWLTFASLALGVGLSADLVHLAGPGARVVLELAAAGLLGTVLAILGPWLAVDRELRFWVAAGLACALPCCLGWPTDRVLCACLFVTPGLVARLAELAPDRAAAAADPSRRSGALRLLAGAMLVRHAVLHPALRSTYWSPIRDMAAAMDSAATRGALAGPGPAGRTLVFVNPPGPFFTQYLPPIRACLGLPQPRRLRILFPGMWRARLARPEARVLEVSIEGRLYENPFCNVFRGPGNPLRVGERIDLDGFVYRVGAVEPDGSPSTIRVELDDDPDSDRFLWLAWAGDRYEAFALPPVGGVRSLEPVVARDELLGRSGPLRRLVDRFRGADPGP